MPTSTSFRSVPSRRETRHDAATCFNGDALNGSDALRGETVKVKAALQPHLLARRSRRASMCLMVMAGAGEMVQFVSGKGAGKDVEEAGTE